MLGLSCVSRSRGKESERFIYPHLQFKCNLGDYRIRVSKMKGGDMNGH